MILFLTLHSIYSQSYLYKYIDFIMKMIVLYFISEKVDLFVLMNNLIKIYMIFMQIHDCENNILFCLY